MKFLLACFWLSAVGLAVGEEMSRLVVLTIPKKMSDSLRAEFGKGEQAAQLETMDRILKHREVKMMFDHTEGANVWGPQIATDGAMPVARSRLVHPLKPVPTWVEGFNLSQEASFNSRKSHLGVMLGLRLGLQFMPEEKSVFGFSGDTDLAIESGIWREVMSWQTETEETMVWHYGTINELPAEGNIPKKSSDQYFHEIYRIEVKLFTIEKSDISKFLEVKDSNRDDALEWLEKKGRFWRGYRSVASQIWNAKSFGFLKIQGLPVEEGIKQEDIRLQWRNGNHPFSNKEPPTIDWLIRRDGKDDKQEQKTQVMMNSGFWYFVPIDGIPECNVMACKITPQ